MWRVGPAIVMWIRAGRIEARAHVVTSVEPVVGADVLSQAARRRRTRGAMSTGFCPNCGELRVGMFRYCRKCGLDYDAIEVPPAQGARPVTPDAPPVTPDAPARTDPAFRAYDANSLGARGYSTRRNARRLMLIGGLVGLVIGVFLLALIGPGGDNLFVDLLVLVLFPVVGFSLGARVLAELLAR